MTISNKQQLHTELRYRQTRKRNISQVKQRAAEGADKCMRAAKYLSSDRFGTDKPVSGVSYAQHTANPQAKADYDAISELVGCYSDLCGILSWLWKNDKAVS